MRVSREDAWSRAHTMNITRNTMRADGITVGESMDRDAAFLRTLGFNTPDGAPTYDELREELRDKVREAVLSALDNIAEMATGLKSNGPKDQELAALFRGVDPIAERLSFLLMPGSAASQMAKIKSL